MTGHGRSAHRVCLLALAVAGGIALEAARAESPPPVRVTTADETGQGFLMTRLDRCLAVTAAHVMKARRRASLVGSYDDRPLDGEGVLIASDDIADVAVLDVTGPLGRHCGSDFILGASPQALRSTAAAVLAHVPPSGKLGRESLVVVDVRERDVIVAPPPERDAALGGFSGSLITVDDLPAAMILAVVGAKGESRAIRYDQLMPIVRQLADLRRPSTEAAPAATRPVSNATVNLASASGGARVIDWSAAPTKPERAASNLLGSPDGSPWEVPVRLSAATVQIALAGDRVTAIKTLAASTAGIAAEKLPAFWEVLTSVDGTSWSLAYAGAFPRDGTTATATFVAQRARFVRLQLRTAPDSAQSILSIGPLTIS